MRRVIFGGISKVGGWKRFGSTAVYEEKVLNAIESEVNSDLKSKVRQGEKLTRQEEIEYDTAVNRAIWQARSKEMGQGHHPSEETSRSQNNGEKKKVSKHPQTGEIMPEGYIIVKP
jgi:hypothetical protein